MPAIIFQHPSSHVSLDKPFFDAREQDVRPATYEPPTAQDWDQLELYQGLSNLLAKYGAERVMSIVRTLAALNGEAIN